MAYIKSCFVAGISRHGVLTSESALQGEDISMLILLPNDADGIQELDARINGSLDLGELMWSLESDYDVEVQLPRFKMEQQLDLKDTLKKASVVHQ